MLRTVPAVWLVAAGAALLFACAAFASLISRVVDWSGLFRETVDTYRSIFVEPVATGLADWLGLVWRTPAVWDSIYLSALFGALVVGICLRAEYRTCAFLTHQNITNIIGGKSRDPKSAFNIKAVIFTTFLGLYVLGQIGFTVVSCSYSGDLFLLYIPASYSVISFLAVRQTGRGGLNALPLFSRAEAAGIICAPWTVIATVAVLALANRALSA